MDLVFDRGNPRQPRGHAIVYFRARYDPDKLMATYVVTLPISVDFAKYVPPFLASHLAAAPLKDLSSFSLPPVAEEVESHDQLVRLADMRADDLVYAGTISASDLPETMQAASDAVQEYTRLWADFIGATKQARSEEHPVDSGLGVNEVLYSLMNERDRLQELTKLVGKLRFAVEGHDQALGAEAREQIALVGRHLPSHYEVDNLVKAATNDSPNGAVLARLYLDRCYKLLEEDDNSAIELEQRIKSMEESL